MTDKQLRNELNYYSRAFRNNDKRRELNYANWPYEPSKSVITIITNNQLHKKTNKRVLDIGCGDGRHIEYFRKLGFEVVGIDFCKAAVDICKKRFKNDSSVKILQRDITKNRSIKDLGMFDLIIDWSVFDHLRRKLISKYKKNLFLALKNNGYLIISVFDRGISEFYKNKDYMIKEGVYYRGYNISTLSNIIKPLILIDYQKKVLEDESSKYRFNTCLFQYRT